jgi:hypothetical protein
MIVLVVGVSKLRMESVLSYKCQMFPGRDATQGAKTFQIRCLVRSACEQEILGSGTSLLIDYGDVNACARMIEPSHHCLTVVAFGRLEPGSSISLKWIATA